MPARTYGSDGPYVRPSNRNFDDYSDDLRYRTTDPYASTSPYSSAYTSSHPDPHALLHAPAQAVPPQSRSRVRARPTRRTGAVTGGHSRTPLLLRATLVMGLITAGSVSVIRAQGPAPDTSVSLGRRTAQVAAADTVSPVESCQVKHSVTSRSATRWTAVMTVVNSGQAPVQRWTLRWTYPRTAPQALPRLSDGWNATVTTDAGGGQAIDMDPDHAIPAGGSTTIGFVGVGKAPAPANFTLNGVTCG